MGLFDFAKEVGRKLFDTDAEAADNIRDHLNVRLAGLKDLDVQFDDGVCTISGECPDESTHSRAVLIAGDTQGVTKVVAGRPNLSGAAAGREREGGILRNRQRRHAGRDRQTVLRKCGPLYPYSRGQQGADPDPNKIYPGQKIKIPLD